MFRLWGAPLASVVLAAAAGLVLWPILGPTRALIGFSVLLLALLLHHFRNLSLLHAWLTQKGLRTFTSLNVRSAECIDPHYFAVLIGCGATTVNAYLAEDSIADRIGRGLIEGSLTVQDGNLARLRLHHCTLVPPARTLIVAGGNAKLTVSLARSITGPVGAAAASASGSRARRVAMTRWSGREAFSTAVTAMSGAAPCISSRPRRKLAALTPM